MEGLLFQVASTLRAAPGALLQELIEGGEPIGALGAQHAAWLASKGRSATIRETA